MMAKHHLRVNNMNHIAKIGHNSAPTPFDDISTIIADLYDEAKLWLDGEPVTTQQQADALNTLESKIKEAANAAEELRKSEVKPLDDAKSEIQDRYNSLIGKTKSVTGKTVMATECVKDALRPYLLELDRQQRLAAEVARKEAEEKEAAAQAAFANRETLEDREKAEALLQESKRAYAEANKAEKSKAHAKGEGRATGLRSVWRPTLIDEKAAAAWMWKDHRAELMAFVQDYANKAVRAGKRSIEGFDVIEHKEL